VGEYGLKKDYTPLRKASVEGTSGERHIAGYPDEDMSGCVER